MTASSGCSAGGADVAGRPDDPESVGGESLVAHFTKRDLILYALGIGCCGDVDGGGGGGDDGGDGEHDDARDRELRYVHEGHRDFGAFPSFLLSLPFVATRRGGDPEFGVRPFPPEFMAHRLDDGSDRRGPLPGRFYRDVGRARDAGDLPMLHVSQSLTLHEDAAASLFVGERDGDDAGCGDGGGGPVDPPTRVRLETSIASVDPRRIGTFVAYETEYRDRRGRRVASSRTVALILGLDPDAVVPFGGAADARDRLGAGDAAAADGGGDAGGGANDDDDVAPMTVVRYRIPNNAALLYRLGGDYNPIHVDPGDAGRGRRPVLHGLCTLGYSLRAVLRHAHRRGRRGDGPRRREANDGAGLRSVRCDFVGPVFANDVLRVEVRDVGDGTRPGDDSGTELDVRFRAFRERRGRGDRGEGAIDIKDRRDVVVVDGGRAQFRLAGSGSGVAGAVSKL